jgi:hypothetical protein
MLKREILAKPLESDAVTIICSSTLKFRAALSP